MREFQGKGISTGWALGKIKYIDHGIATVSRTVKGPVHEKALFDAAVVIAKTELEEMEQRANKEDREILRVQRLLLDDEVLLDAVESYIMSGTGSAESVERASEAIVSNMEQVPDIYIRERATDVADVCRRLVAILDNKPRGHLDMSEPVILVSDKIFPSDIFTVGSGLILGFAVAEGSPQSHAALIAQTLGIPAVIRLGADCLEECNGRLAAVDGENGLLIIDPDEKVQERVRAYKAESGLRTENWKRLQETPNIAADGTRFQLLGNCSGPEDIEAAIRQGAEGVGLLRTEFSLSGSHLPGEEEQFYYYVSCLNAAAGRTVTVRTFDIGADKLIEGVAMRRSSNPALSLRGLRLFLHRKHLFIPQLCALLRAAARGPMRVMFPMVGSVEEWDAAMEIVEQAKERLRRRNLTFDENLEFGSMIEVPSAAIMAPELIRHGCRFFSIGTNDLAQYTLAVDRMDTDVEEFYRPNDPAVDALIKMAVDAANEGGIPVCICGLAAGTPDMAEHYLKMGVTGFSMASQCLMDVKQRLLQSSK